MNLFMLTLFLVLPGGELQTMQARFAKSMSDCRAWAAHEMQIAKLGPLEGVPAWSCKKVPEWRE